MDKIGSTSIKFYFLTQINSTNSVDTKFSVHGAFWNNFHKVRSKSNDLVSMALSGITFTKYARSQKIGYPNNLKVFRRNKIKEPK
jgi:hypothetical protein